MPISYGPAGCGKRNTGSAVASAMETASPTIPTPTAKRNATRWVGVRSAGWTVGAMFFRSQTRTNNPVSMYAGIVCQRSPSTRTCATAISSVIGAEWRSQRTARGSETVDAMNVARLANANRASRALISSPPGR